MKSTMCSLALLTGLLVVGSALAEDTEDQRRRHADEVRAAQAYEEALRSAETEQRAALDAVAAARREFERRAQAEFNEADRRREQAVRELADVRHELERAHENLRRASREVARVHREIARPAPALAPSFRYAFRSGDKAVIGVVLGDSTQRGVHVLGVSPDGPAERAGLKPGDLIVSVMGTSMAGDEELPFGVLQEALAEIQEGDELVLGVEREGEVNEYTVVAEKREPFTWHSYSRLPSAPPAPMAPGAPRIAGHLEIPDIDREGLDAEMARLRERLDQERVIIHGERVLRIRDGDEEYEYEFGEFSELGDEVLGNMNVWFGLPLTRGLKLAELDADLGAYFATDTGVLVLKARADNDLQLRSGDVILRVGEAEVRRPADVMRALRELETGSALRMDIMRDRQRQTLSVDIPEERLGRRAAWPGAFVELETEAFAPEVPASPPEPD